MSEKTAESQNYIDLRIQITEALVVSMKNKLNKLIDDLGNVSDPITIDYVKPIYDELSCSTERFGSLIKAINALNEIIIDEENPKPF